MKLGIKERGPRIDFLGPKEKKKKEVVMKKGIMLGCLIFLVWLTGCTSGITRYLPKETGDNYCQVTIMRSSNIVSLLSTMAVIVDRRVIADLQSGEYISFPLKPGAHSLVVTGGPYNTPALDYDFEPNCEVFFLAGPAFATWIEIEEIPKEKALGKMKSYKQITNLLEEE